MCAVRGRYSAEMLANQGFGFCDVWGDPALLLPLVYLPKVSFRYDVGIVPHISEYSFFRKRYSEYHVVDLHTTKVEQVIQEIVSCKMVLSTSLHGLIVAHAYGIPALWIKKNNIGTDGIKFYDYFSSVGISEYDGFTDIDELLKLVEANSLDKETLDLQLPKYPLAGIQERLLSVAPFELDDKFKKYSQL